MNKCEFCGKFYDRKRYNFCDICPDCRDKTMNGNKSRKLYKNRKLLQMKKLIWKLYNDNMISEEVALLLLENTTNKRVCMW